MQIREMLIPKGNINRPGLSLNPTSVTIHTTANTAKSAGAANHAKYLANNTTRTGGWHWVVDNKEAILCVPENEVTRHAGDGTGLKSGNRTSLAVEICENNAKNNKLDEPTYNNAVELTADICRRYGWSVDKITTHRAWKGGGTCPRLLQGKDWDKFIADVKAKLETPKVHIIKPGDTYWLIGKQYGIDYKLLMKWNPWPAGALPIGAKMWLEEPPSYVDTLRKQLEELKAEVHSYKSQLEVYQSKLAAIKSILDKV
ncbi:MAG TPA: N-acetylmuramoyl-L-alanine amidase [Fervidobacterium sp.]|nr:N-acetylmuramoyl-L-alanine amidase [Fervidobacterium sp.]